MSSNNWSFNGWNNGSSNVTLPLADSETITKSVTYTAQYKEIVIENPSEVQKADTNYVLITFDANDLNNAATNEVIRGRIDSKKSNSTLKDQEIITYAVLKGTKWSDFVSTAATPTLATKNEPYWLFSQSNTYNVNSWKTSRSGIDTGTKTILASDSHDKVESVFGTGEREITYYAQYFENVPTGLSIKSNKNINLFVLLGLTIMGIVLVLIMLRRKSNYGE